MTATAHDIGVPLGGLNVLAPLGAGRTGITWSATTPAGEQVALRVLPPVAEDAARARARRRRALADVVHPGLVRVLAVPAGADPRVLLTERIPGPTLATVRTARLGLRGAEALGVALALAQALAALHAHGLAHGDVAPANVVLTAQPVRPVLVDLLGDLATEAGSPGFVAPEVRAGRTASPAADVWSLATLCLWVTGPVDRDHVAARLESALMTDPRHRPSAAELATSLAEERVEEVDIPDAATLAGAALRERAQRAPTVTRPSRRVPRHRRRSRRRPLVAAVVLLLLGGVLGWLLWPHLDPAGAEPEQAEPAAADSTTRATPTEPAEPPEPDPPTSDPPTSDPPTSDPTPPAAAVPAAVTELVAARDEAITAADAGALAALTAPASPARHQDDALLAQLGASGTTVQGLVTDVAGVEVEAVTATSATVEVELGQREHTRVVDSVAVTVPATPPRCVQMTLTASEGDWLVERSEPCAAG